MKNIILAAMLLSSFAQAQVVQCEGTNPRVAKASLTVTLNDEGQVQKAVWHYQRLWDEPSPAVDTELNVKEVEEAVLGYQRFNFLFAHHNTVIKVSADADIFGGVAEADHDSDPFQGVLFYQRGNGNSTIDRFQVQCHK